ncbi:MAG TPA: nucleotide pyrophosphohydrolase [Longimicrobium sp.]|jgi:NTP pyrophosphatase (non-canonical NTP hydrolase)|uniref:nucleotide pyrophosphohydrolase n=1 Tax=Longimicrobium sp. TaxID=2029185 RepID=UPI002ED7A712
MDLREIQQQVDAYIGQFKEGYFPPLVNLARLTEEVGELAREINHAYGPKTKKHDEPEGDIALELGDILFVVVVLANQLGIDLSDAAARTLSKYQVRDADRWERKDEGTGDKGTGDEGTGDRGQGTGDSGQGIAGTGRGAGPVRSAAPPPGEHHSPTSPETAGGG